MEQNQVMAPRPPIPPFTRETAIEKVRLAEDGWNTRDPAKVALAYTVDSRWRNRAEFSTAARDRRVPDPQVEPRTRLPADQGTLGRHGQPHRRAIRLRVPRRLRALVSLLRQRELGVRRRRTDARRYACINDLPIEESDRLFRWPLGRRPDDHPGLSELGL